MASEDSLQDEFEESNDKDEQSVGSSAFKDSSDMDEGYQSVGFAIDSKAISGAQEVSGSDGVGAAAQAAAKPLKIKQGNTKRYENAGNKIDKTKKDATPIKFVVWCGVGAFVILLVGGVTYRPIQRRKDRKFVVSIVELYIEAHEAEVTFPVWTNLRVST